MATIFITEGMRVSVTDPPSTEEAGAEQLVLNVAYDHCVAWARMALERRAVAVEAMTGRRAAWAGGGSPAERSLAIEHEFDTSTQCIVAAAACVDALYGQLRELGIVSDATVNSWESNDTARHARVAQTIIRVFPTSNAVSSALSEQLRALFTLRDRALHPSGAFGPAYRHPDMDSATAWNFTTFRGDVADYFCCLAVGLLWDLANLPKYRSTAVDRFAKELKEALTRLLPDGKPLFPDVGVTFTKPPK